jgi:hypothetical protein
MVPGENRSDADGPTSIEDLTMYSPAGKSPDTDPDSSVAEKGALKLRTKRRLRKKAGKYLLLEMDLDNIQIFASVREIPGRNF